MMVPEPLRSATDIGNAEDTSLALPSDKNLSTGQQRVLNQVLSIKRNKSRHSKNGTSSPSLTSQNPITPSTQNEFGTFKFSPSKLNGNFSRANSVMSAGHDKATHALQTNAKSFRTTMGRHASSSSTWEQQISPSNWPQKANGLKPSRSDPALAPAFSAAPSGTVKAKGQIAQSQSTVRVRGTKQSTMMNGTHITTSQTGMVRPPSAQSHEGKLGTLKKNKTDQTSIVNSVTNMSTMTLKEAVEFLSRPDENYQLCGATFIQHATFNVDGAKDEVSQLGGIQSLVALLESPNPAVTQAVAGALRNLVFKNQNNKMGVQFCGGIAKALQLLQKTDSTETQKQVTGLLWNMSSAEDLKKELIATALPALTKRVVMPFNSWADGASGGPIDPSVFYFATGCLRNLSCGEESERQAMRKCPDLIDSLMSYMQSCVAEEKPDDESVENCACILHNLTYQLEQECPESFSSYFPSKETQSESKKGVKVGCFSPRSSKVQKQFNFDQQENSVPSGVSWLSHPKAMDVYLALLCSSEKQATLEASCGALQNLTASGKEGSSAVSHVLIQKLKPLFLLPSLLSSPYESLPKTTFSLLDNMSRPSSLKSSMAKFALIEITNFLSSGKHKEEKPDEKFDETLATACSAVHRLMVADSETSKKAITYDFVISVVDLSEKESFSKASKAASLLLYNIWNEKTLQTIVKKLGLNKSVFQNEKTTAEYESMQNNK